MRVSLFEFFWAAGSDGHASIIGSGGVLVGGSASIAFHQELPVQRSGYSYASRTSAGVTHPLPRRPARPLPRRLTVGEPAPLMIGGAATITCRLAVTAAAVLAVKGEAVVEAWPAPDDELVFLLLDDAA
jgi:hypothetical protein